MFCRYELDPDDDLNIDSDDLFKKAMRLFGAKKKPANLVQVEKKSPGVEDVVEKCDYQTHISSTQSCLVTSPSLQSSLASQRPPLFRQVVRIIDL